VTGCGRCHRCRTEIRELVDGQEWCDDCQAYQRPREHGWPASFCTDSKPCPPRRRAETLAGQLGLLAD
jgi:hypothetical protein